MVFAWFIVLPPPNPWSARNGLAAEPPPLMKRLGDAVTVSVTGVACVSVPVALVPMSASVKVPGGVVALVVTVSVDDPDPPGMVVGLKVALVFAGSPVTLRLMTS